MTIDITAFDVVGPCSEGQPMPLKDEKDNDTGIQLLVLGKHADPVVKFTSKLINKQMRDAQMGQKTGKPVVRSLEDLKEQNVEAAAVRVVGWINVKQAFAEDLMKTALRRNPHWVDQIIDFSDNIENFTSGSEAT